MPASSEPAQADNTILSFSGMGIPPYSARGLTQSLEPIGEASQLRRTINGSLKDLSVSQFRKYKSVISGDDQQPPAFAQRWPGNTIIVDCIAELAYETDSAEVPEREIVSSRTEGDFTFYRPRITFRIVSFSMDADEWEAGVKWKLELEEI